MTETLKIQRRFLPIDEQKVDKNTLTFSFSSEAPVKRYFGDEILDHDEESVDLTRLNTGAAPLLFNHDPNQVLGKVTKAWIEDKRGKATIKWATNPRALEIRKDVSDTGATVEVSRILIRFDLTQVSLFDAKTEERI